MAWLMVDVEQLRVFSEVVKAGEICLELQHIYNVNVAKFTSLISMLLT